MNWRHRIAVVMLMCLAALPLAGMVCAMTCVSGSSAVAAHHEDGQDCERSTSSNSSSDSAESAPEARLGVLSATHCGTHDGALPQVAATAAQRADDLAVMSAAVTSDQVHPLFGSITTFHPLFEYSPPPGTAPPTTTPLVLRV